MLTFHELYERHAPDVLRFAYWLSGSVQEAEDICSETFVRAWVSQQPIRTETVRAYLFAIARNVFLGERRREARLSDLPETHPDSAPGVEQAASDHLALEQALRLLQQLSESDRAALIMRAWYDMSYEEIARVLGLSLTATKVRIHRARLRIAAARLQEGD